MAVEQICCVCHIPVAADAPHLGSRLYCERHFTRVTQDRRGLWASTLFGIVALLLFVGLVVAVVRFANPVVAGTALAVTGVVLALVPALIWLGVFYSMDRLEPEPKRFIVGIFVLGALLAQGAAIPLVRDLFEAPRWIGLHGTLVNLAGSILIVGFVQEYLKYAGIRFTVYNSPEFDERVDGIIYGMAIGLGFATMLNLEYVLSNGGVRLDVGVMRIAVAALAHASFSGISGYFLGRAKFEAMPSWWLPVGVTMAAVLNGIVSLVLRAVAVQGLDFTPTYALLLAAGVAGATFAGLFVLIRRINAATLAQAGVTPPVSG